MLTHTGSEFTITDKDCDTILVIERDGDSVGLWNPMGRTALSFPMEHLGEVIEALQMIQANAILRRSLNESLAGRTEPSPELTNMRAQAQGAL